MNSLKNETNSIHVSLISIVPRNDRLNNNVSEVKQRLEKYVSATKHQNGVAWRIPKLTVINSIEKKKFVA